MTSAYPPRDVQGFYKKAELETLIRRRDSRHPLAEAPIASAIVNRYYQQHAIRAISESFASGRRKVLLVHATGTGKTRTAIALTDLLSRCNWIKRVLFLADRTALVLQAERAFLPPLSTGLFPGEPRHQPRRQGPGVSLHPSDDDEPH